MDREEIIGYLRACLLSAKGGIKIENLNRDYKLLVGENIPFPALGYPTLDAFLRTIPGIRINNRGGDCYIEAQPSSKSAHLTKLILHQKSVSKKPRKNLASPRKYTTPFRAPYTTKRDVRPTKNTTENYYSHMTSKCVTIIKGNSDAKPTRVNAPTQYMEMPTRVSLPYNDKGRYIPPPTGLITTSPSKRLKDRQAYAALSMPNQSIIKSKDATPLKTNITSEKVAMPVISQKPKTANNTETLNKGKYSSNLNERFKINQYLPPTPIISNNSVSTMSSPSEVLSPLSPAQLVTDGNDFRFQSAFIPSQTTMETGRKITSSPTTLDAREKLRIRAKELHLTEPDYKILPTRMKNAKEVAVYAQVKVGPHGYTSYPQEARSEDEAQELAASIALLDLDDKYGSVSEIQTTNENLIKQRVTEIVRNYPNGIFVQQIPVNYKQQHKEVLPTNWLTIINDCSSIQSEKGADNSVILTIVTVRKPSELIQPSRLNVKPSPPMESVTSGHIQLPQSQVWLVCVTSVASSIEIWARIEDDPCSEQFNRMETEMTQYYGTDQALRPLTAIVGNLYAVLEDDCWHRVRCTGYDTSTGVANVLFIDHGDEDCYPQNKLWTLDKRFTALPPQAVRLSLYGLEDFSESETAVDIIENLLLNKLFYVEVMKSNKDEQGPRVSVIFYDTHGPEDVNLNKALSKSILQAIVTTPKLDVGGQVSEVFMSNVEENGDVYIQTQSESMKLLVNLLNRLIHTGLNKEDLSRSVVNVIDTGKVYFVSVDESWYRGKIIDIFQNNTLKMFLIDFGKTVISGRANLLYLDNLSEILARYPAQALKVHLHNIEKSMFNAKMASRLVELAPCGESLLVKVVMPSVNNAPVVELFKRIQPSNMLVSINTTLIYEEDLLRLQGDGNNNVKPRKRVERLNSKTNTVENIETEKSLKPPKISAINNFFDVHVVMAANPGNFIVQPFADKEVLKAMMNQLQVACNAYKGSNPMLQSVKIGQFCAGLHINGQWYRVYISDIIDKNTVTVYFCDVGDVLVLQVNKLQPLQSQFFELPYQAIKARLVGVKPVNIDWSVEDCLRFQRLVGYRNFVSVVCEVESDKSSPVDTVVGLKLIDVDTAEDIYIDRLLVEEGRAILVDP
ncbi:hypothetical protein KM043_007752 [Ampulex compressa]|nr:hypothetical protein KM043_007752 [Ampulex compressa]